MSRGTQRERAGMYGPPPKPLVDRLAARIRFAESGCWEWTGYVDKVGYGRVRVGSLRDATRDVIAAHLAAYRELVGPIPDGLEIDHLCRNRACVNPDHLEAVPPIINWARGESPTLYNALKPRCPQGHDYITTPSGKRRCRTCDNARRRERTRLAAA